MLKTLKTTCLVALLMGIAAGTAYADKLQDVLDRGYLIAGSGSTNAPWHFKDENNALVGFDIDMLRLIAKGLFDDPPRLNSSTSPVTLASQTWSPTRSMWPVSS